MCLRFLATLLSFLRTTFAQHPFNFGRVNAGQMLKPFKWTFIQGPLAVSNAAEDVDWKWTYLLSSNFVNGRMCLRFLATLHFNVNTMCVSRLRFHMETWINGRWAFCPQTAQIQSCLFYKGRLRNVQSFQRHSLSYFLLMKSFVLPRPCHRYPVVVFAKVLSSYTVKHNFSFLSVTALLTKRTKKHLRCTSISILAQ